MAQANRAKILLADDDSDDLDLIVEAISTVDPTASIHAVDSGKKVLSYLSNVNDTGLPAIVLLDYNMPDLTALQILIAIRDVERFRNIVKVVWSTSNSPKFIQECKSAGAREYFVKPSNVHELKKIAAYIVYAGRPTAN